MLLAEAARWHPGLHQYLGSTHRGQMSMRPRRLRPWLTISDGHLAAPVGGRVTWMAAIYHKSRDLCASAVCSPLTAEHTRCSCLWVTWPAPQVVATWMWLYYLPKVTWLVRFWSPPMTKVQDTWCHVFSSHGPGILFSRLTTWLLLAETALALGALVN